MVDAEGMQRVLAEVPPYRIDTADLSAAGAAEIAAHIESIRADLSHYVAPADAWPLFVIRATRLPEDRVLALAAGMNDTLAKPFDPAVLYARLAHYTGRPAAAASPPGPGPPT